MKLKIRFYIVFILFFCIFISLGFAEERYYPYPIIFVHGINSDPSAWDTTIAKLRKYFYNDDGTCKYSDYGGDYLIALDYESQNNGDIPTIARTVLKPKIDETITKLPEGHKKVIIVAHSMGGLVTRSLLKQYPEYQDKIEKVVFIGTPHLGAPAASAVWILNKVYNDALLPMSSDYSKFYGQNVGSRFTFADKSAIMKLTGLSAKINNGLKNQIEKYKARLKRFLNLRNIFPKPVPQLDGIAMEQLRLDQNVWFQKVLSESFFNKAKNIIISFQINRNETFLGKASENLAIPNDIRIIKGKNASWGKSFLVNELVDISSNDFSFIEGSSLEDAANTGDGIVTRVSQEGIGAADYTIDAFHTDELNAWQTILQAIEDKPVIESVRAVAVDWEKTRHWRFKLWGDISSPDFPLYDYIGTNNDYYLIIKVKDYLVADIEIESIALNGEFVILPDNFKGQDENYKPYNAFKKDFLLRHEDTTATYKDFDGNMSYINELQPGEFLVKIDLTDKNTVSIKVKNPAGLTTEKILKLSPSPIVSFIWEPTIAWGGNWNLFCGDISPFDIDRPPYWSYGSLSSHQLTFSLKVQNSSFQRIRYNVFIEGREGIVKRLITQINDNASGEILNLTDNVNGQSVYGKEFNDIITWYGEDDNGGYNYPLYVFWYISPIHFVFSHVMVEVIDDPTDDLLPLSVVTYSAPIGIL